MCMKGIQRKREREREKYEGGNIVQASGACPGVNGPAINSTHSRSRVSELHQINKFGFLLMNKSIFEKFIKLNF